MSGEPRDGGADVESVYQASRSGPYPMPYLTSNDLKALSDMCLRGARVICNLEAFEIDGEWDVPRIDLSFSGEGPEEKSRSWQERAATSASHVDNLLLDVSKEKNPIMFSVWLDWD